MLNMAIFNLVLVIVIFNCLSVYGIEDYCSVNQFENDGNFMEFTKEASISEFAITGNFKGLHCCAKGYRSIEWYKDGKPYPWHGTLSQMIIYPESANQTIYTQSVGLEDSGNYTCLLRNDSLVYTHTINLKVFEKVPDDPKITYISQDIPACVGQSLRLFCEAFVGYVDLPDAHNEASWSKTGENVTLDDDPRFHQVKISREDDQIYGSYLVINNLKKEDYGKYTCTITKPGRKVDLYTYIYEIKNSVYIDPNPVPYKKLLLAGAIAFLIIVTVLILNLQYGLFLRVHFKDRFGRLPENDEKINDVLVLYSEKDAEISLGVLLPTLEAKYNYKCGSRQLPQNINTWYRDLLEASRRSHRIVAVISPACVNDSWECSILYQALKQLYELDTQFCCITLTQFPSSGNNVKNLQGESFSSIVRNINVINWERSKDEKFWLTLRLKLPPKRYSDVILNENKNPTRLNTGNSLSMHV